MTKNNRKPADEPTRDQSNETEQRSQEQLEQATQQEPSEEKSVTQRALAVVAVPAGFKVVKQVTRPLLKHPDNSTVYVRILSAIYQGKEIKGSKMAPAEIVDVNDLTRPGSNVEFQYIVSAVLKGVLTEEYPNNSYVGKSFAIVAYPKEDGKRYRNFGIAELSAE